MSLGWIGMVVFWGLLVWGAYALITHAIHRPADRGDGDDPLRILDQRLARGEIDAGEYQRLRDLLTSGTRHASTAR